MTAEVFDDPAAVWSLWFLSPVCIGSSPNLLRALLSGSASSEALASFLVD